jgi:hypothetical protein
MDRTTAQDWVDENGKLAATENPALQATLMPGAMTVLRS